MATRMQQRKGTAAQWISTNNGDGPVLNAGEIGFELDTNKFKIGDGINHWVDLTYFTDAASVTDALNTIIDGAPAALNTLNELAAALGDDPSFLSSLATQEYVDSAVTNSTFDASSAAGAGIEWNAETEQFDVDGTIATTSYADNAASSAVSTHNSDTTSVHGITNTADLATKEYADSAVGTHSLDTTSVHGITNTADLATKDYADNSVSTHNADTTDVHGIPDTSVLATNSHVSTSVSTHNDDTTGVHGISDTSELATKTYSDTAVSTHSSDTTNVHGITDTADLATKDYADSAVSAAVSSHQSDTTSIHGIADTSALATKAYADLAADTAEADAITAAGTAADTKISTAVAALTKSSVGLENVDNTSDANKPVSTATQSALDLKAPLSGPTFTGTVVLPSTTSIGDVSSTELGYLNDVTSAIQTQLNDKLSKTGGTMTGAITLHADPSSSLHAATKQYVDNTASGVIAKPQVLGATNSNIDATYNNGTAGVGATLTHNTNGVFPADAGGASGWAVGKGILVRSQTNKAQNGRYFISDMGSVSTPYVLTRCSYCDEASEIPGAYIFVQDGTFAGTGWIQVVADPATFVVGTDNIDVFQFSGSGTITAGTGITVSGNEVSIANGAITSSLILDGTIANADINASAAIAQSKIANLTTDLAAKAPLASPTFTGTVTVAAAGVAFTDGTQTKEGVASRTPIIQKTAGYTLSTLTHRDSLIEMGSASAITLSIPTDATLNYPIGTSIDVLQTGAGQVTIAAVTPGTTAVNATPGLKLRGQWSSCTLFKRAANTWIVMGDLSV